VPLFFNISHDDIDGIPIKWGLIQYRIMAHPTKIVLSTVAQEIAVGLSKRLAQGYAMKASRCVKYHQGMTHDDSTMFQKWYPLVMSTVCELEAMAQSK